MRILIDIGHPAHVHLFRNFANEMQSKGHQILFTCREKEFEIDLLKSGNFEYVSFGKKFISASGKIMGLVIFNLKMLKVSLKFKPDIFLSAGSMYAAQVSYLLRKPHITLEDSENMEQIILYKPFTRMILTPDAIPLKYGKKQMRYNGFHQSAYLHPKYFNKGENIKRDFGIDIDEKVFLLRLVALNASHDTSLENISYQRIRSIINILKDKGQVFISSEKPLIKEFEKYKLNIKPERIHDFISICDLLIGESGAMTNEAAYLGIPNILVVDLELNVHKKYADLGLKIHFREITDERIAEIESIVDNIEKLKISFQEKSKNFINTSVDLNELLMDTVESLK